MRVHRFLCFATTLIAAIGASAQGISVTAQPFEEGARALPIAPAAAPQPAAPAAGGKAIPSYVLRTGEPIHTEIKAWAEREGWLLLWGPRVSWSTLREARMDGTDAASAVAEVIDILREEGKPVALRISAGNRVMEVLSTEVHDD